MAEELRVCIDCGKPKPIAEFRKGGHSRRDRCTECSNKYQRLYRSPPLIVKLVYHLPSNKPGFKNKRTLCGRLINENIVIVDSEDATCKMCKKLALYLSSL